MNDLFKNIQEMHLQATVITTICTNTNTNRMNETVKVKARLAPGRNHRTIHSYRRPRPSTSCCLSIWV
jgi:hypothetical protein